MRENTALLSILCLLLGLSCKKTKINVDEGAIRLLAVESMYNIVEKNVIQIAYDNAGRISKVTSRTNNDPALLMFDVLYKNNEIILVHLALQNDMFISKDSTWLILDAAGRVSKKVKYSFYELRGPYQAPQQTFRRDTIIYAYDASGMIKKETMQIWDSSWYNPDIRRTYITRTNGTTDYTNDAGKTTRAQTKNNSRTVLRQAGLEYITSSSYEAEHTYYFTKGYPFKTDFSNAAVLDQINLFSGVPMNKSYGFVPDKIEEVNSDKDGNGNITSSGKYTINRRLTYNTYGFIATQQDESLPNNITRFIYSQ